jgi:hypothetical protein
MNRLEEIPGAHACGVPRTRGTQNWRATPLTSRLAVVELIANTTTKTGLTIRCELDTNTYPKGIKVSEEQMEALNLKGDEFHPDWNYSISPRGQIVEP